MNALLPPEGRGGLLERNHPRGVLQIPVSASAASCEVSRGKPRLARPSRLRLRCSGSAPAGPARPGLSRKPGNGQKRQQMALVACSRFSVVLSKAEKHVLRSAGWPPAAPGAAAGRRGAGPPAPAPPGRPRTPQRPAPAPAPAPGRPGRPRTAPVPVPAAPRAAALPARRERPCPARQCRGAPGQRRCGSERGPGRLRPAAGVSPQRAARPRALGLCFRARLRAACRQPSQPSVRKVVWNRDVFSSLYRPSLCTSHWQRP